MKYSTYSLNAKSNKRFITTWAYKEGRNKYSHFEVNNGEGYFSIYDGEETESIIWDLSSVFLADQSDKLKEFLNKL